MFDAGSHDPANGRSGRRGETSPAPSRPTAPSWWRGRECVAKALSIVRGRFRWRPTPLWSYRISLFAEDSPVIGAHGVTDIARLLACKMV